jgi:hypothetical protein
MFSSALDHGFGADWTSLLNAIGTEQFEEVLKRFLSSLVGAQGCAALLRHCAPANLSLSRAKLRQSQESPKSLA